jgi:hypothetical protein
MESVETPQEEFEHWYDEEVHHEAIAPEEYCEALIDEMGLKSGDVFKSDGQVYKVHTIDPFSGNVVLKDPTSHHPQDARSGTWEASLRDLYRDWKRGKAVPATIEVATNA